MRRSYRGRHNRSGKAIQKTWWKLALAVMASSGVTHGAMLIWDASGMNPKNPQTGGGTWNTTTSANWSNGSKDTPWVNGSYAAIAASSPPAPPPGTVITIDDPSGSIWASEIDLYLPYTIAAIPGDSPAVVGQDLILFSGTISAPITGTRSIESAGGGTLTLTGHSTYTGTTNAGDNTILLANGASLGNTQIAGSHFLAQGTTTAGTGGPGTSGATLGPIISFSMIDGTAGTFTLKQESSFVGTALVSRPKN
jgi:hypothetical protein